MENILESAEGTLDNVQTTAIGPEGSLPLTDEMLRHWPSGHLFGMTQNAGMGWPARDMLGPQVLLLSTAGGVRAPDGSPVALGYHTGHWEVNLLVQAAALELKRLGGVPFAAFCTDPCDGRTQGTPGMYDSLPFRNDAAALFRRQIRSLPTRQAVLGAATCDKGLPAMMMALAATPELPTALIPGGVTLPPRVGEDAAKVQTIGARYAHGKISLEEAARAGCSACASPGGGCQFMGTAATSQVVGEALGLTLPHAALAPSGQTNMARHGTADGTGALANDPAPAANREHSDRRLGSQCHGGSCGLRGLDQLTSASACDCFFGRSDPPDGRGLDRHQPSRSADRRRAAQRTRESSDGASLSGRRRSGSDAPSTRVGAAAA